jgi:hypothetical protein
MRQEKDSRLQRMNFCLLDSFTQKSSKQMTRFPSRRSILIIYVNLIRLAKPTSVKI